MPAQSRTEYHREWCARNREHVNKYQREWYEKKRRANGVDTLSESKMGKKNPNWKGDLAVSRNPEYLKEWRKKNEDYVRDREYRKRFGITLGQYDQLLAKQEGVCAICCCVPSRRRLDTDHCHATGKVRGLLCDTCNRAISLFDDNPELLRQAARYLENARS